MLAFIEQSANSPPPPRFSNQHSFQTGPDPNRDSGFFANLGFRPMLTLKRKPPIPNQGPGFLLIVNLIFFNVHTSKGDAF